MSNCIFCKIIAGDIPCLKIAENSRALAFMDINPLSRGHALIIPKFCAAQYHQLPSEYVAPTAELVHKVSKALAAQNYNILQNNGKLAHQEVMHVHFHVIPKTARADGLGIRWDQIGDLSKDEMKQMAEQLAAKIVTDDAAGKQ